MSTRLTKEDKRRIVQKVIKDTFSERVRLLLSARAKLAMDIQRDAVPAAAAERLLGLPAGLVHTASIASVCFATHRAVLPFDGYVGINGWHENVPGDICLAYPDEEITIPTYSAGHEFQVRYEKLAAVKSKIEADIATAKVQAEAMVNSATTVAKLRAIWPEVDKFLPESLGVHYAPVPAITADKLNKSLEKFGEVVAYNGGAGLMTLDPSAIPLIVRGSVRYVAPGIAPTTWVKQRGASGTLLSRI